MRLPFRKNSAVIGPPPSAEGELVMASAECDALAERLGQALARRDHALYELHRQARSDSRRSLISRLRHERGIDAARAHSVGCFTSSIQVVAKVRTTFTKQAQALLGPDAVLADEGERHAVADG